MIPLPPQRRVLLIAAAALTLFPLNARADLVARWTFDEPTGTTAADSSPSGATHLGLLENGASFVPTGGRFGGAVTLDGIDDVVRVADHSDLGFDAATSFTLAFWFKTSTDFSNNRGLVGKGYHTSPFTAGYYVIRAGSDEVPDFDSRQTSAANTPRLLFDSAAPAAELRDGNWHHIVFVKDLAAGETRLYYDNGPPVVRALTAAAGDWAMGVNADDFYFGRYLERWTEGMFDDAGIWDQALSAMEVEIIYQGGVGAWLAASGPDDVVISEFMASNDDTLLDEDGDSSDWIEIWNPTTSAVSLAGWHLSDDLANPTQWAFPAITLPANSYLVVFASSKNRAVVGAELHTNFQIARSGGALTLSRPDGAGGTETVHSFDSYVPQFSDISYGLFGSSAPLGSGYFPLPTPGASNGGGAVQGFVGDTAFSIDRGFYTTTQPVEITATTLGASIIYTTDGTVPTEAPLNGTRVDSADANTPPTATVNITTTTQLRARAVRADFAPSDVDTQTYIFPADVLTQSTPGETFRFWGPPGPPPGGPDWEMDPDVVGHADLASRCVTDDLLEIPTLSISLPFADMWGANGIYATLDQDTEKDCSIEFLNPNGDPANPNLERGFNVGGTIQIVGGSSAVDWRSDKLSMRIKFEPDLRNENPFDRPWIPFGAEATDRYDTLVLDARFNLNWNHPSSGQRARGQNVRDQYAADLQNALGGTAPHGRHMHVYISGLYWGMYTVHERPDDNFAASYYGGDNSDYDVLKHGNGVDDEDDIVSGTNTAYLAMQALASNLSVRANYEAIAAVLDLEDLARYMLVNYYIGNTDWPHHNWYASYNRVQPGAKWHFHSWDAERGQLNNDDDVAILITDNGTIIPRDDGGSPGRLHWRLAENLEYRLLFADLVRKEFFNGGNLTPTNAATHYMNRIDIINEAVRAESARWGDSKLSPSTAPLTRGGAWLTELNRLIDSYLPVRTDNVLGHFISRDWYPATGAPDFAQHGGDVPTAFALTITSPDGGTIYYTLDGSDPREAFTSNPVGNTYSTPVLLDQTGIVNARVRSGGGAWSALTSALFIVDAQEANSSNLVISEIHYNPAAPSAAEIDAGFSDKDDFEFLELLNVGASAVNLTDLRFSVGIDFDFSLHSSIPQLEPGARVLIVKNLAAFEMRYGTGLPVAGVFQNDTGLSNGGETLTLINVDLPVGSQVVQSITYNDRTPWPEAPDGDGVSLTLINAAANPDSSLPANWRSSVAIGGSPATDDAVTLADWLAGFGLPAGSGLVDNDLDGQLNIFEYAFGSDPTEGASRSELTISTGTFTDDSGTAEYPTLSFTRNNAADGVTITAETSFNLIDWSELTEIVDHVGEGAGIDRLTYRSTSPISDNDRQFFRVHAIQ